MQQEDGSSDEPRLVSNRTMDIVAALLFLAVAGLVIMDSVRLGFGWQDGVGPGAGYFPFYIALIMGGASLVNLVRALVQAQVPGETFVSRPAFAQVLAVLLPLLVFAVAIAFIGIYVSAAIFITLFMMYFGSYAVYRAAPVGLAVALVLFFLFEKWFLVPLPKGPLEAWLGY